MQVKALYLTPLCWADCLLSCLTWQQINILSDSGMNVNGMGMRSGMCACVHVCKGSHWCAFSYCRSVCYVGLQIIYMFFPRKCKIKLKVLFISWHTQTQVTLYEAHLMQGMLKMEHTSSMFIKRCIWLTKAKWRYWLRHSKQMVRSSELTWDTLKTENESLVTL